MQKKLLFLSVLSFLLVTELSAQNANLVKVFNQTDTVSVSSKGRSITAVNGQVFEFLKDSIRISIWDTSNASTPAIEQEIFSPDFYDLVQGDFEVVGSSYIFSVSLFNKTNPSQGNVNFMRMYQNGNFGGYQTYISNPNFPLFGKQPFYSLLGRVNEDKFFVFDHVNIRAIAYERASNGVSMVPAYDIDMTAVTTDSSHIGGIGGRRDADVLYVWNKEENRIVRLDTSGTIRLSYDFDNQTDIPGRSLEIVGFHVEDNGRVVVSVEDVPSASQKSLTNATTQRLVFLGGGFQFLGSVELPLGGNRGDFNPIEQVGVDYDGNIYLGESGNRKITQLTYFDHAPFSSNGFQSDIQAIPLNTITPIDYSKLTLLDWNIQDTLAAIRLYPQLFTTSFMTLYLDGNSDGVFDLSERIGSNVIDSLDVSASDILAGKLALGSTLPQYIGDTFSAFHYKWSDDGVRFNSLIRGALFAYTISSEAVITGTSGKDGWRLLAPLRDGETYQEYLDPVWTQGATGSDLPSGAPNVFTYNTADEEWVPVTDFSEALSIGDAFAIYMYEDDDFFAEGIQGGWPKTLPVDISKASWDRLDNISIGLEYNSNKSIPEFQGYNLVGNPYSTGLRTYDHGALGDSLAQGVAYWNASLNNGEGGYVYGLFSDISSEYLNIAPAQAFWVEAKGLTPSVTFTSFNALNGIYEVPKLVPSESIKLLLNDDGYSDEVKLRNEDVSFKKLRSISNDYHEIYTYGKFGEKLAINSLNFESEEIIIPFGIRSTRFSKATLELQSSLATQSVLIRQRLGNGEVILHQAVNDQFKLDLVQSGEEWIHQGELEFVILTSTNVSNESDDGLPSRFDVGAYPNPFNPSTNIQYALPEASKVSIEIFNISGQKVLQVLSQEQKQAGVHNARVNLSTQSSGVYFVRVQANGIIRTQKITLIK